MPKRNCWVFHCSYLYYPHCPSWFNLHFYYTHSEMHRRAMHRVFKMSWSLHSLKTVFQSFHPSFYILFALLSPDQHWIVIFIKILHPQESILELHQWKQNLSLVCKIKIISSLCTLFIYTDYSTSIKIEFSFTSQFLFIKGYINFFLIYCAVFFHFLLNKRLFREEKTVPPCSWQGRVALSPAAVLPIAEWPKSYRQV